MRSLATALAPNFVRIHRLCCPCSTELPICITVDLSPCATHAQWSICRDAGDRHLHRLRYDLFIAGLRSSPLSEQVALRYAAEAV